MPACSVPFPSVSLFVTARRGLRIAGREENISPLRRGSFSSPRGCHRIDLRKFAPPKGIPRVDDSSPSSSFFLSLPFSPPLIVATFNEKKSWHPILKIDCAAHEILALSPCPPRCNATLVESRSSGPTREKRRQSDADCKRQTECCAVSPTDPDTDRAGY